MSRRRCLLSDRISWGACLLNFELYPQLCVISESQARARQARAHSHRGVVSRVPRPLLQRNPVSVCEEQIVIDFNFLCGERFMCSQICHLAGKRNGPCGICAP